MRYTPRIPSTRFLGLLLASLGMVLGIPPGLGKASADAPQVVGTFYANDNGVYYMQQTGNTLWWLGESVDAGLYPNQVWHRGLDSTSVFKGTISGGTATGDWVEVSRGSSLRTGTMTLAIDQVTDALGTHVHLTLASGTAPNGASDWLQGDTLNDALFVYPDGHAEFVDFFDRFALAKKSIGPGVSDLDGGDPLGQTDNPHQLRPYRDQTVFYGNIQTISPDQSTNHAPQINVPVPGSSGAFDWTYQNFACKAADGDIDLNARIDGSSLTTDFLSGLGWSAVNARDEGEFSGDDSQDILPKLEAAGPITEGFNLHMEGIMYGGDKVSGCPTSAAILLPGWAATGGNSILVNGRPIDAYNHPENITIASSTTRPVDSGSLAFSGLNGYPIVAADPPNGIDIGQGTEVRVTGALILDCGHSSIDDDENYSVSTDSFPYFALKSCDQGESDVQNHEIHTFYSLDLIECPLGYAPGYCPDDNNTARPNLTGAWGSNDGGTYYIRQVGNDIWWAGLTRNRDPIQLNGSIPLLNPIPNPTNAFHGTITNNADGSATITGDAVTLPKGQETGGDTTTATFAVGADRKSMNLTSSSSADFPWPVHFDKLYEPGDTTPPTSTLTIGNPQYSTAGRTYVTSATPLTLSATDADGVQNLWYRIYPTGSTAPGYTSVAGDTATLHVTGVDGQYTIDTYATDNAGNDETPHSTSVYLDNSGPQITITTPAMGTTYTVGQALTAAFGCTDSGSGLASCTGSLANGAAINTSSPGSFAFTVNATDNLGNTNSKTVSYAVSYRICPLYNTTKPLGAPNSSVAIKLQLCDANNANLSSSTIVVTALNVDGSKPPIPSGRANPGNVFRYDVTIAGYVYNLQTKGLSVGNHLLNFSVQQDPVSHAVGFVLK